MCSGDLKLYMQYFVIPMTPKAMPPEVLIGLPLAASSKTRTQTKRDPPGRPQKWNKRMSITTVLKVATQNYIRVSGSPLQFLS